MLYTDDIDPSVTNFRSLTDSIDHQKNKLILTESIIDLKG